MTAAADVRKEQTDMPYKDDHQTFTKDTKFVIGQK